LKNHNRWTTYHHIEMLSVVNKMDDGARDSLHKLRQKRNSIVHDRREVNESDAYNCLFIADRILHNRFNNPDTPFRDVH
jgi:aminoglycoside phosphotransferase